MALLARYRHLRTEQLDGVGEIDYNFGRAFQQLGKACSSFPLDATLIISTRVVLARGHPL
jgi:hypothetical protein